MEIKRVQSPDYPAIGLKEAVDRCRRLYGQIQAHPAPRQIVVQGLGFNTMHGGAMSALAAARKYGLLVKLGETIKITELAKRILFPKSDVERDAALQEAALKPPLFSELFRTFGPNPPTETLMLNYLIRAGFLASAAKTAIASYKESLPYVQGDELAASDAEEYSSNEELEAATPPEEATEMVVQSPQERASNAVTLAQPGAWSLVNVPSATPREGERRLFDYDFEATGGVGVVTRGPVETEEALDVIEAWIGWKRKELARKAKTRVPEALPQLAEKESDGSHD